MITLPVSAVQDSDDSGNSVAPEAGDTLTLTDVQAKVVAVNGDQVDLIVTSVNGTDAKQADAGPDDPDDAGESANPDKAKILAIIAQHDGKDGIES